MRKLENLIALVLAGALLVLLGAGCSAQARKNRHLARAEKYFNAGQYEPARIEFLNVLRVDRTNTQAIQRLGVILFEQGASLQAYPFLSKAKDLVPGDLDVRLKLGSVLLSAGQVTNARNEAIAILDQSATNDEAILLLVEASATNQLKDTQQRLQKLRERTGDRAVFHLASANLYAGDQDMKSAENEVKQALVMDPKFRPGHLAMAAFALSRTNLAQAEQELKTASDLAPVRSATRLRYAQFKAQSGAVEESKRLLGEITGKAPDYLPAWSLLAQIAYGEKKFDAAASSLERVLRVDSGNFDSRLLLAQVRRAQGTPAKAVEELENLNRIYPRVPQVKYQLALAQLQNSNVVQAKADLDQAIALKPDFVEALLLEAEINLGKGDAASVVAAMSDLLRKRPEVVRAHLLLAQAYRGLNRMEDAANVYRGLMKAAPKQPQPPFLLGLVLRQQDKNEEARAAFEKALVLATNDLFIADQLVDLDILEKKFPDALARVQVEIQRDPKAAGPRFLEGRIYAAQNDGDKAEAALRKVVELDPNFSGAYYLLATTYMAAKKAPRAAEELEGLLAKNAKDQRGLMLLATIYNEMKDYAKARQAYEKLLAINPRFIPALNNLAYLYAEQLGQLDRAYDLARKVREMQPDNPAVADTLGWILYRRGDFQQALALIREGAEKLPANPEIQCHFGMACYMMGQAEAARSALQQAVRSTAAFPGKEEAKRRLAFLESDPTTPGGASIADLEKMSKEYPADVLVRMRLGELYEREGAADKAEKSYEEVLKVNPKAASATLKLALLNAGPLQNRAKAFDLAKRARELAPGDAQVAQTLGRLAFQSGDFPWACSLLQESARTLGTRADVLYDLAWAAYSLGRVGEAEQSMQRALQVEPQFAQANAAKWFLAMIALGRDPKNPSQAESQAGELLKMDPNHVPALMVMAAVQAGRGDGMSAVQTYEKVLRRFPQFAPAQKALAELYANDPANEKKAYDLAVQARQALPDDVVLAKTLGKISYKRKDYRYAVRLLEETAKGRPADAENYYYLGMAHYQLKEKPQSEEALQKGLAGGLSAPLVAEAKRVLAELQK